MRLETPPSDLFFKKNDPADPRLGERARTVDPRDLTAPAPVLWGAPDDEGIRLNGGRPGAALAPNEIRRAFYKMTPPPRGPFPAEIFDVGNLSLSGSLADRHERARALSEELHRKSHFTLSLGGGHDYGFPDAAGFVEVYQNQKPLVINFDAHLDVRPVDKGPHSGTPFRRLLEGFPKKFEFWELGLQPQCNSRAHADWAEAQDTHLVFLEDLRARAPEILWPETDAKRPCFISLDLDVFSSKEAPGCSASYATGLLVEDFLIWLEFLMTSFNVRGIGFYEVSPPLDSDNRTSKLAALILFHALRFRAKKGTP
jgi:formiminoglutamase